MDERKWETVKELAERKKVTIASVYRWLREGKVEKNPDTPKLRVRERVFTKKNRPTIHVPSFKRYINNSKAVLYAEGIYKRLYINFDREFTVVKDNHVILKTLNEDAAVTLYNNI